MSDKLLQEFLAKLQKTRSTVFDTKKQCEFLKKDAKRLEQELSQLEMNKDELLQIEVTLKSRYIATKLKNEEESERDSLECETLTGLRKLKRVKLKEKESLSGELAKLNRELAQAVQQREQLELTAHALNSKLGQVSFERASADKRRVSLKGLTDEFAALDQSEPIN